MAIAFKGWATPSIAGQTGTWTIFSGSSQFTGMDGVLGSVTPAAGDIAIIVVGIGSTADRAITATTADWTKFATELYSNGSSFDANAAIFYYVFTNSTIPTLAISGGTGNNADAGACACFLLSGVDTTTPLDATIQTATGTGTSNPNPPSITPVTTGAWVIGCGVGSCATATNHTNPGGYASGTNEFQSRVRADTNDASAFMGVYEQNWSSGAIDPAQVTGGSANAGDSWAAFSIALRPSATGPQTLTPGLFSNSQTFYAPTVTTGAVTLTPGLFTNSQAFYGPAVTGPQVLEPSLFTNSQSFDAPTVSPGPVSLTPGLFTNSQAFYDAAVVAGAVTLSPSFFANEQAFYSPTVVPGTVALECEVLGNDQTFYAATLERAWGSGDVLSSSPDWSASAATGAAWSEGSSTSVTWTSIPPSDASWTP